VRYNRNRAVMRALFAAGAAVNDTDKAKRTPLMYACENPDQAEIVAALLSAGANIDDRDKDGRTALVWAAAKARSPQFVMTLLKSGANGAFKASDGNTAYDYAAANDSLKGTDACEALQKAQDFFEFVRSATPDQVTEALSRGAKAEDQDEDGCTPLMYAAERNPDPAAVVALLKAGARIDDRDPSGRTSLMLAARRSRSPGVVASLLASGASGQLKSRAGRTAFDYVAANESLKRTTAYGALQRAQNLCELVRTATPDLVEAALASGAKAEDQDEDQWTPLMYAAESNPDPRVITALLKAGAAIDDQGPGGWTPLMLAARASRNPEVVMTLLKAGASGQVKSNDGKTAFDWATGNAKIKGTAAYKALERAQNFFERARTCSPADVQEAVTKGANVNDRDEQGWTPLMYAAQRNDNPKVIAALVKAGANIDDRTLDGFTPLMLAARDTRTPDVIVALLKAGADGTLTSDAGKTAFDYAAGNPKLKGTAAYKALNKARLPPPEPAAPPAQPAPAPAKSRN